jgi:Leucine-rich repeat (LRR) protein
MLGVPGVAFAWPWAIVDHLAFTTGQLPCHRYFHSTSTTLNSVPDWQGNFKKVQRIDCANNLLARVPPSMGHLKNLKEFSLRYNSLDDR